MIYKLIFISAFAVVAFAEKAPPLVAVNEAEVSYGFILGDLEYYLLHNIAGTKKCYMQLKEDYFNAVQNFGWGLKGHQENGTFEKLGNSYREKEKVNGVSDILRKNIGGALHNKYIPQLGSFIQAVNFGDAVFLLNEHRDAIRENLEAYKKAMKDLTYLKKYKELEEILGGSLRDIMASTGQIFKELKSCIKEEKCKSPFGHKGQILKISKS